MDAVEVTISFDPKSGKFLVSSGGSEPEAFTGVDAALQEARGILTGRKESESPEEDEMEAMKEGFNSARGVPLA